MKNSVLLLFCAAAMATVGLTGCGKPAESVSTPAEHDSIKGRQATPAEMSAAMARAAQSHQQTPQQPK